MEVRGNSAAAHPPAGFRLTRNFKCAVKGWPIRIDEVRPDGSLIVSDKQHAIAVARYGRYRRYKNGVANACAELAAQYKLDLVNFQKGDVVVDCGANIGEIGVYLKQFGIDYHPFEPEELEADCCDWNNFDGAARTIRKGLWNQTTELAFYSNPDSADGSLIDPGGAVDCFQLPVLALDDYVEERGIERIRLLKLEAEGGEPEVLEGARNSLAKIDWIAADCGPERGTEKLATLAPVSNFLLANGFEMVDCWKGRLCALYRNTRASRLD